MRDALVFGTPAAELGGDRGFGLLELRFQASRLILVAIGPLGDGVADVDQVGRNLAAAVSAFSEGYVDDATLGISQRPPTLQWQQRHTAGMQLLSLECL